ncbi:MAG: glycosyltransferase [Bacteroidales bacterium]
MGWLLFPVLIYAGLILYYTLVFYRKRHRGESQFINGFLPHVSVVIPLRNEAHHIQELVQSLSRQAYPADRLEFIWVNDHSTDATIELLEFELHRQGFPFRSHVISLEFGENGKRKALTLGITMASHEIIATLDADCTVVPHWIYAMMNKQRQQNAAMVMGPVLLKYQQSFFSKFMALEQLSLTATAAASTWAGNPILCSGANLVFYKADFLTYVHTYAPPVSAGDDIFFMLFLKKNKKRIEYLASTDAIVTTEAPANLNQFLNQRIRWVSKSRYYSDPSIIGVALVVAIANASLVMLLIGAIFLPAVWQLWLVGMLIKASTDFPLLLSAARWYEQQKIIRIYPLALLIYPIFVVYASIYGNFGKYSWKQRNSQ